MNVNNADIPVVPLTGNGDITGDKVRLREKQLNDARDDYRWQADRELAALDAAPVLSVSFPVYLLDYTGQLNETEMNRYPLSVDSLDGKHIGNCTLYDIDEARSEAQLGIMIGERDYWDKGYGTDTIRTITRYVFLESKLNRVYLKTLTSNLRAQACFSKGGFVPCGRLSRNGYDFVIMELYRDRWREYFESSKAGIDG